MKVLGITGGIASGKSLVSNYFKSLGFDVIDADQITHELLKDESVLKTINQTFDGVVSGGKLDKQKLANYIFNDATKKMALEAIIHPRVYKRIECKLENLSDKSWVILDVPLLYETFKENLYDKVLVVYVDENTQMKRLVDRDQIDYDYAKKKIEAQLSLDKKKQMADFVVDNSGSITETKNQIDQIIEELN